MQNDQVATEAFNRMFPGSALNRTPAQMQQYGQQLAGLQINPQRQQWQRSLEQAMANATAQQGSINAAYAGVPQQLQQAAEEARRRALESAISRGVGRSGVVDYQATKIGEEQQRQLGQSEAQKAAQLAAVANQLGLTQQQAQEQLAQLAAREGELAAAYIPQAEDAQFGRQMQVAEYVFPTQGQQLDYLALLQTGVGQVADPWSPHGTNVTTSQEQPAAGAQQQGTTQAGLAAAVAAQGQPNYQQTLSWFGSPEAYAAEIKRKEAAGQQFDDPAAAAAFKRDYANLF